MEVTLFYCKLCTYTTVSSDAKKTVFDWCKEGKVKRMAGMLKRDEVNNKDQQVSVWRGRGWFVQGGGGRELLAC